MSVLVTRPAPKVGSIVNARGRDWVVLPAAEEHVVRLRPLTGTEDDAVGIYLPLETWSNSSFAPPDPAQSADVGGGTLLLDAARLALRDGAAPFRSLGRLSVTPRPYQFVPLIMALRQERIRLLIADDVGVGKTIEAGMIARELLDRGLARRLGVICPAHLCEQWETELREKFGIQAALIQPSRYARLERDLPRQDWSVFRYHRHLVASVDFVKAGQLRAPFIENAPDLLIVDEAHACARPKGEGGRTEQQRYELLHDLMTANPDRHLLLVTATPHSGIEESFRSLLGLLEPRFDLGPGAAADGFDRDALVPHIVQRRRDDLRRWLGADTPFPERLTPEERTYALSREYHALFDDVLAYCREAVVAGPGMRAHHQRVRYWAAISLLRCIISSPRAAAIVLGSRAQRKGFELSLDEGLGADDADALYRNQVMDAVDEETARDVVPTAPAEDAEPLLRESERRRLSDFLKRARALEGPAKDAKLAELCAALTDMIGAGFRPIVFCHYIPTANYVAESLPKLLKGALGAVTVTAVTGEIGDEERRAKIAELVATPGKRVLVATDCISEGINLQEWFDAVVHYDLPWNPNRIEQREGRVDRFGQTSPAVRRTLIYGADNQIDPLVMEVLIRKERKIREDLGVSVPVPAGSDQVVESVLESVLLNRPDPKAKGAQLAFSFEGAGVSRLHATWDESAARQKETRRFFAQHGIKPDEVSAELRASDQVLGDADAIRRFLAEALDRLGGSLTETKRDGVYELNPGALLPALKAREMNATSYTVVFDRAKDPKAVYLGRTHPIVAACCDLVLGRALDLEPDSAFARCGTRLTDAVERRTGIVLLRLRYLLTEATDEFAEEVVIAAFQRKDGQLAWLQPWEETARDLLARARPVGNPSATERADGARWALETLTASPEWHRPIVAWRTDEIRGAHNRLRKLTKHAAITVSPHEPPDILGCYALIPAGGSR